MFLTITVIAVGIVVGTLIAWLLRKRHVENREQARKCKCRLEDRTTCLKPTLRLYKMKRVDRIDPKTLADKSGEYRSTIYDMCSSHVLITDERIKKFSHSQILRRMCADPDQFTEDKELIRKAELLEKAILPLDPLMEEFEKKGEQRAQQIVHVASQPSSLTTTSTTPAPAPKVAKPPRLSIRLRSDNTLSIGHLPKPNNQVRD